MKHVADQVVGQPKVVAEGKFLRLLDRDGWEYAERKNISGVVAVVAITREGALVLTEQLRRSVGTTVIDLPAGLAGDTPDSEGEALELAAERELVEEVGFQASSMRRLADCTPSPGMTSEIITFFGAEGLTRVGEGGGVADEGITVHVVPLVELSAFLERARARGALVDMKIYAGLNLVGR